MNCNDFEIVINGKKFELKDEIQTGRKLKEMAAIQLCDTLFLNVAGGDDAVIHNDVEVRLKSHACLYSCPPAKYGDQVELDAELGHSGKIEVVEQQGWKIVLLHDYKVPAAFAPNSIRLLLKLPPLFPEAQPDMFWVSPHLRLRSGSAPQSTSTEQVLGEPWQRFSWHLEAGAWRPGVSRLRDFVNCIRARFAKGN